VRENPSRLQRNTLKGGKKRTVVHGKNVRNGRETLTRHNRRERGTEAAAYERGALGERRTEILGKSRYKGEKLIRHFKNLSQARGGGGHAKKEVGKYTD